MAGKGWRRQKPHELQLSAEADIDQISSNVCSADEAAVQEGCDFPPEAHFEDITRTENDYYGQIPSYRTTKEVKILTGKCGNVEGGISAKKGGACDLKSVSFVVPRFSADRS